VKEIRKMLNMSQGAFAKRLGVSAAGISKIESGSRNLTGQMLLMICKEFNINENWLRYGEGEIFRQKLPVDIEQLAQCYHLDDMDQKIIYEYAKLDEKKRDVIKEYILRIAYGSGNSNLLKDGASSAKIAKCAEDADTIYGE
jgi:transcriptional regulator with XRE-family HTH domain